MERQVSLHSYSSCFTVTWDSDQVKQRLCLFWLRNGRAVLAVYQPSLLWKKVSRVAMYVLQ